MNEIFIYWKGVYSNGIEINGTVFKTLSFAVHQILLSYSGNAYWNKWVHIQIWFKDNLDWK